MSDNSPSGAGTPSLGRSRQLSGLPGGMTRLCALFEHDEIDRAQFLEQCTRLVTDAIGCSRVGLWVFVESAAGLVLRCVAMYDAVTQGMTLVPDQTEDVDPYFMALKQPGYVMASDTRAHPAITGSYAQHLESRGVHSLLAVSFSVNGAVYGAFTCTEVGRQTQWDTRQLAALRQVGARASLTLFRRSRFTASTGLGPLA